MSRPFNIKEIKLSFFENQKSQLLSKKIIGNKNIEDSSEEAWNKLYKAFNQGYPFFFQYARMKFSDSFQEKIFDSIKNLKKLINSQPVLNQNISIPKEILRGFFFAAEGALLNNNHNAAYSLFYLLTRATPENFNAWIGLGLTCDVIGKDLMAIEAFTFAKKLRESDLLPYLYCAESYAKLGNWKMVKQNCKEGLKIVTKNDEKAVRSFNKLLSLANQKKA